MIAALGVSSLGWALGCLLPVGRQSLVFCRVSIKPVLATDCQRELKQVLKRVLVLAR